jgi:hypothetical protein
MISVLYSDGRLVELKTAKNKKIECTGIYKRDPVARNDVLEKKSVSDHQIKAKPTVVQRSKTVSNIDTVKESKSSKPNPFKSTGVKNAKPQSKPETKPLTKQPPKSEISKPQPKEEMKPQPKPKPAPSKEAVEQTDILMKMFEDDEEQFSLANSNNINTESADNEVAQPQTAEKIKTDEADMQVRRTRKRRRVMKKRTFMDGTFIIN